MDFDVRNEQNGIVIRYDSIKKKLIVFDRILGKIEGYIYCKNSKNINLCNGSYINYKVVDDKNRIKFSEIVIINVPLDLAKKNILFLHHILELSYFFLPTQMQLVEVFDLINFVIYSFNGLEDNNKQKLFLIKFFLTLGTYPESDYLKVYLSKIINLPIDSIIDQSIDLFNDEKKLDLWIGSCIKMHPNLNAFNTISYLKRIKIL